MRFSQIYLALRARIKIVMLILIITVLSASITSLLLPKSYKATTQVVLNGQGRDAVTGEISASQQASSYQMTQIDVIKSKRVALDVVDMLKLEKNTSMQHEYIDRTKGRVDIKNWLSAQLDKKLEVSPVRESNVLEISFSNHDPRLAAEIANAFAKAYQNISLQLKIEPAQKAAFYFRGQIKVLRDNLEQAQSRLSQYQQENGITSLDEKLDVENSRLNELSQQLVIAQASAIEARSRQKNVLSNANNSPDVAMNPVIQNLRVEAAKADSKLAELSERLDKNHPEYEAAKAEAENIKGQLQQELARTANNISSSALIQKQREDDLRAQLALQKEEVLKLNRSRDQLAVLEKDVDSAQKAIDAATQRFTQTSMEAEANQGDIAILTAAEPPASPSSPKIFLNMLLSILVGGFLAIGMGLVAELMDRRVRSSDDLSELLNIPVVALVNKKPRITGIRLLADQSARYLPTV